MTIVTPRLQREAFNNGYACARGLGAPYLPEHDVVIEHWHAGFRAGDAETNRRGPKVNRHLSGITAADWRQERITGR